MQYTLPKFFILRGYQTFSDVIKNGQLLQTESLLCFYKIVYHIVQKNKVEKNSRLQIGFSVPKKKFPLAVHRNRIKRLLREAFRKNQQIFAPLHGGNAKTNIVVIYNKDIAKDHPVVHLHDIEVEWIHLAQHLVERIQGKQ